jgi:nicotinate-nucleotide adenylyltransferase
VSRRPTQLDQAQFDQARVDHVTVDPVPAAQGPVGQGPVGQGPVAQDPSGRPPLRIGVMGGTFDPIHHGHLVAASEVRSRFGLDRVVFVPTGDPWQKTRVVTAAEHRYLMTVVATASNPAFTVSRLDIDRPGPTYTVDTLRAMADVYGPDAELFFITGADALTQILSWHAVDELFDLAQFIGCTRPGHPLDITGLPADRVTLLEIPALSISSTDCRRRVSAGEPIWYLVPDGVVQYVTKEQLYITDVARPAPPARLSVAR